MEEVAVGDKTYISSKRAAELCGYTQDYVGQLARSGQIEAQRIGGLWYVFLESVQAYKTKADSYKPAPPKYNPSSQSDSSITFEGKEYISASRASKLSQYNQDYIGQLARSGKIASRLVGNRWYVNHDELVAHKKEKDSLLAAVQAESVGLRRPEPVDVPSVAENADTPTLTYSSDDRELMPSLITEGYSAYTPHVPLHTESYSDTERAEDTLVETEPETMADEPESIPIRVLKQAPYQPDTRVLRQEILKEEKRSVRIPRKSIFKATYLLGAASLCVAIGLGATAYVNRSGGNSTASAGSYASVAAAMGDSLEKLLTRELIYIRE